MIYIHIHIFQAHVCGAEGSVGVKIIAKNKKIKIKKEKMYFVLGQNLAVFRTESWLCA